MDFLSLQDWIRVLTNLGLQSPAVILGVVLWFTIRDRRQFEERYRLEREQFEDELKSIIREQIEASKNTSFALSTLVSLLSSGRKGHG